MERKKLSNFSYKKVLSFADLAFFSLLFINTTLNLILDMFIREYKPYFLPTNIENCSIISYILNLAGIAYIEFIEYYLPILLSIVQLSFNKKFFKVQTALLFITIATTLLLYTFAYIRFLIL